LSADATTPAEKALMQSLIRDLPPEIRPSREITIKPLVTPALPDGHIGLFAIFASPLGWVVLLVLYAANLYAAYEVALFRNQPAEKVCGLAAIPLFGVASPVYFLAQPARFRPEEDGGVLRAPAAATAPIPVAAGTLRGIPAQEAAHAVAEKPASAAASAASEPPAPPLPPPVVYQRGDFSFNRRFFETKLPGFFRVVLSGADKDMVILVKSSRGDFTGKRIPRITQTELYLQVFKEEASAEEMIPFGEIQEVQVRHKDLAD
jgi:hypothetical protein